MNNELTIENYDKRTYYDYLKLKDVNTKHFLMIAELIDNSISSFEHKYSSDWKEKLEIKIKMNFEGDEISIYGLELIKGSYIEFDDNGFGMSKDELFNAVRLNNKSSFRNSKMNVHGRGLKQSAFFFGTDLTIETKKDELSHCIKQKLSDQKGIDEPYIINPFEIYKKNRGTKVIIGNIHSNKIISHSRWKKIVKALEFRYIKYLQKGNLKISYKYNNENQNCFSNERREEKITVAQAYNINDWTNEFRKFINEVEESVKKMKKRRKRNHEIDVNTVDSTFRLIKNIFIEANDNNTKEFEFDMQIDILGKPLDFKFWMLPQKQASFRGIRLYEGERAINHAGYQYSETKPYMGWKNHSMETGSTENRFAGSVDLAQLGIVSKTDKSSFTMSEKTRMEIDKKIFSVWATFNEFTIKARKEKKFSKGIKPSVSDNDALENISSQKFPAKNISLISSGCIKNKVSSKWNYEDELNSLWEINIILNEKIQPKDIFAKHVNDNELEMIVFTGHEFWKDIDKLGKQNFYVEAVIPITLLLAIQNIEIENNKNMDPTDAWNTGSNIFKND